MDRVSLPVYTGGSGFFKTFYMRMLSVDFLVPLFGKVEDHYSSSFSYNYTFTEPFTWLTWGMDDAVYTEYIYLPYCESAYAWCSVNI